VKVSPIQLLRLFFRTVKVDLNEEHAPAQLPNPLESFFSFDGVVIDNAIGVERVEGTHEHGSVWSVFMAVKIENRPDESKPKQRFCPYNVLIEAQALFLAVDGAEKIADVEDLISVNGSAILWSAIREQVSSITARMPYGIVGLPTVNFHDLKKNGSKPPVSEVADQGRLISK
jgi:preprotein translocase subunit SecB